jgi:uncharacterized membrane protein
MNRDVARAGIVIGCFLLVSGLLLLLMVQPGTAEYYITLFVVLVAIIFTAAIAFAVRMGQR